MTLDELIEDLQCARKEMGKDIAIRAVNRSSALSADGQQRDLMSTRVVDGYHDKVLLIFLGAVVATMDWPRDDVFPPG